MQDIAFLAKRKAGLEEFDDIFSLRASAKNERV